MIVGGCAAEDECGSVADPSADGCGKSSTNLDDVVVVDGWAADDGGALPVPLGYFQVKEIGLKTPSIQYSNPF